jgi:primosomal protein N' (replication factor Y)
MNEKAKERVARAEEVAVDVYLPIRSWRAYSYRADRGQLPTVVRGCRVLVPVRKGWRVGFAEGIRDIPSDAELKTIKEFLDTEPWVSSELWKLAMWISSYYFCAPGQTLEAMFPGPLRSRPVRKLFPVLEHVDAAVNELPESARSVLKVLVDRGAVFMRTIEELIGAKEARSAVRRLTEEGFARWGISASSAGTGKTVRVARLSEDVTVAAAPSPAGAALVEALAAAGGTLPVPELIRRAGTSRGPVVTLAKRGLVSVSVEQAGYRIPMDIPSANHWPAPKLTAAQEHAANTVSHSVIARKFRSFLLQGVTGSGKTEVYLAASAKALELGLGVICLVPEIALSTQVVSRFRDRFGDTVVLLHSALSAGERCDAWEMVRQRSAQLVVGPRSAIFAPVKNLGLVVVDEEHEPTFKQEHHPRYNGRDVAIVRAKLAGCPVILGSATPSLESYHRARSGRHELLRLEDRIARLPMPSVTVVDMKTEPPRKELNVLSSILQCKLEDAVTAGQQALILLNRRGFSRSVQCGDCGHIPACPDCEISLTFHRKDHTLVCHYCHFREPAPRLCARCSSHRLRYGGVGTERLEEEVRKLLPSAVTIRMDSDTTKSKGSHGRILSQMMQRKADILVGTQMIAKGLDFPGVSVVGVVNADTPLQFPDFRAGERAFQMLTQVAGRAGRREPGGEVVLQSYLVDYPALLCATRHDYETFAEEELIERREASYPPFTHLIRILMRSTSEERVDDESKKLRDLLSRRMPRKGGRVLGPAPPILRKLKGYHRRHLLLFHSSRASLHTWLHDTLDSLGESFPSGGVRMIIDVDPIETV